MVPEHFQLALFGNEVRRDPIHEDLSVTTRFERYDPKRDEGENDNDDLQKDEEAAIYSSCSPSGDYSEGPFQRDRKDR